MVFLILGIVLVVVSVTLLVVSVAAGRSSRESIAHVTTLVAKLLSTRPNTRKSMGPFEHLHYPAFPRLKNVEGYRYQVEGIGNICDLRGTSNMVFYDTILCVTPEAGKAAPALLIHTAYPPYKRQLQVELLPIYGHTFGEAAQKQLEAICQRHAVAVTTAAQNILHIEKTVHFKEDAALFKLAEAIFMWYVAQVDQAGEAEEPAADLEVAKTFLSIYAKEGDATAAFLRKPLGKRAEEFYSTRFFGTERPKS